MMATKTELVLGNPKQLKQYLETLSTDFELRFPSVTSLKGDFAVIMIIYNTITKCVLLGAYNTKLSGLPKDEVFVEGSNFSIEETPFTLLRYGIAKETGLIIISAKLLGLPKKVRNTNPDIDAEFHERNYALITEFKGEVKMPDEKLNPKIKEFVWVKDFMLNIIFDQQLQKSGISVKPHAQKEAFDRFNENKRSKPVTFSKFLAKRISKIKIRSK